MRPKRSRWTPPPVAARCRCSHPGGRGLIYGGMRDAILDRALGQLVAEGHVRRTASDDSVIPSEAIAKPPIPTCGDRNRRPLARSTVAPSEPETSNRMRCSKRGRSASRGSLNPRATHTTTRVFGNSFPPRSGPKPVSALRALWRRKRETGNAGPTEPPDSERRQRSCQLNPSNVVRPHCDPAEVENFAITSGDRPSPKMRDPRRPRRRRGSPRRRVRMQRRIETGRPAASGATRPP